MYINIEDYEQYINPEELAVITGNSTTIRQKAEKTAMNKIRLLLSRQFNVDMIFSKIGDDRDDYIVEAVITLALYNLYTRIAKEKVPDDRYEQYKYSMKVLKMLKDDELNSDLPRNVGEENKETEPAVRFDSNPKTEHYY